MCTWLTVDLFSPQPVWNDFAVTNIAEPQATTGSCVVEPHASTTEP